MEPLSKEEESQLTCPRAIQWQLTDSIREQISASAIEADSISSDLSITLLRFDKITRADLKARQVSPDTAIQMV